MIQKSSIWRVYQEFAKNPRKDYQIRELSRKLKLAHTSIRLHLHELEKDNMIKREKNGIYYSYKANFEDNNFRFYKKMNNLITLHESGIINDIENETTPDAIILFGSYAKGEDIETSDIDLFIFGKEKKLHLEKYEKILNRKIQLFFSEDIKKTPTELQNNILNGILLTGFVRWKV